jgi:hypothetical protein
MPKRPSQNVVHWHGGLAISLSAERSRSISGCESLAMMMEKLIAGVEGCAR